MAIWENKWLQKLIILVIIKLIILVLNENGILRFVERGVQAGRGYPPH